MSAPTRHRVRAKFKPSIGEVDDWCTPWLPSLGEAIRRSRRWCRAYQFAAVWIEPEGCARPGHADPVDDSGQPIAVAR